MDDDHEAGGADGSPPPPADSGPGQPSPLAQALQTRLAEQVSAGFEDLVRALWAELSKTPIRRLVDPEQMRAAITAALGRPVVEGATLPLVRLATVQVLGALHRRPEPIAEFVPAPAQEALSRLVAHPELLPEQIIREVMRDPAVEAVLNDLLVEALRQFADRTNPFTADWGLPALLKRLPPFGTGPLKSAIKTMRADFEKRLDPEIRKFTSGFSRRASSRLTELSVRKQREPEFVALRQKVLGAMLKQELGELSWGPEDPRGVELVEVVSEITHHLLLQGLLRDELLGLLDQAWERHQDHSLGELLAAWSVDLPDPAPLAAAYRPLVETVLQTEAVGTALQQALAQAREDYSDER